MFPDDLEKQAAALLVLCRNRRLKLATAESCTGGLVAGCLTAIGGSSDVVDRGFVTYTNEAKVDMLGVPAALIATHNPDLARRMDRVVTLRDGKILAA